MMTKVAALLLASPAGLLEKLGDKRAGILLLVGALAIGYTSNEIIDRTVGSVGAVLEDHGEEIDSLDVRTTALEDWRVVHEETVSGPGVRNIERNAQTVDSLHSEVRMIRAMVYQMYCLQWPDRCRGVPEGGGS